MFYLREGLVCLESPDRPSQISDLRTGSSWEVSQEQIQEARKYIFGQKEMGNPSFDQELLDSRQEPFDGVLRAKLEDLDRGFSWMNEKKHSGLLRFCELVHSLQKNSRHDFDQLPVLPETTARRALHLERLVGPGGRVVFVGDDDLVSVAVSYLGLQATVVELDPELIDLFSIVNDRLGFDINVQQVDLRQPVPTALLSSFDAFCTDPEMSRECISLFLSRGISLVKPGGFGIIACAEEWSSLMESIVNESRLSPTSHHRRFANYRDWTFQLSGYRSDLYSFSITQESCPLIGPEQRFDAPLFPFGLSEGHHLLIKATGCDPESLLGKRLVELIRSSIETDSEKVQTADTNPFPLRVVRVWSTKRSIQATVSADRQTVHFDLSPAPEDEKQITEIASQITEKLGALKLSMNALEKIE